MGTFAADLDLLVQAIQTVSSTKNYWLIRTQSGIYIRHLLQITISQLDIKKYL